jgi:hypothetical protein
MKQILLTLMSLFIFGGVYSQDSIQDSVYQKINQLRKKSKLEVLTNDTSLELASAQHGCWLALYNSKMDSVVLTSIEENKTTMAQSIRTPEDRVKNYTNREFKIVNESMFVFYQNPTAEMVYKKLYKESLSSKFKYQGFWIIKFETPSGEPIWYLVQLLTD